VFDLGKDKGEDLTKSQVSEKMGKTPLGSGRSALAPQAFPQISGERGQPPIRKAEVAGDPACRWPA
jgi:hypothetical protein